MKRRSMFFGGLCIFGLLVSCDPFDFDMNEINEEKEESFTALEDVAAILSMVPLGQEQMQEVLDATGASAGNGYDEEYLMKDLFEVPGKGVGDSPTKAAGSYSVPLKELFKKAASEYFATTKAAGDVDAGEFLDSLSVSDIQIYWPFSQEWDGESLPVVTWDPGDDAERNVGYSLNRDGSVQKVFVSEKMASEQPVWVINRNSDAQYKSLEMRRREDPDWGNGGGDIVIRSSATMSDEMKTLVLRSFKANRNYDSWFQGGSEFFVKCGSIENFMASTEAELRLYEPTITDFLIVVRRNQIGEELPFNAVLVSDWAAQLGNCAFMMLEDDGGTRTTWKCTAMVKYNSKNYGFEVELPMNSRDDIVWRGSLTRSYIERYSGLPARYGDVELVLELI